MTKQELTDERGAAENALATELTRLRQRGLERLDSTVDHHRPLVTPILDKLIADRGFNPHATRVERVIDFMREALLQYGDPYPAEAAFIASLFFNVDGRAPGPVGPSELLERARRSRSLSASAFRKLQRQHLLALASFLLSWAPEPDPEPDPDYPEHGWLLVAGIALTLLALGVIAGYLLR